MFDVQTRTLEKPDFSVLFKLEISVGDEGLPTIVKIDGIERQLGDGWNWISNRSTIQVNEPASSVSVEW